MATPTKQIPDIPLTTTINGGDAFLAKFAGTTKPDKVNWSTLAATALSGLPPGYLFVTPPPTTPGP